MIGWTEIIAIIGSMASVVGVIFFLPLKISVIFTLLLLFFFLIIIFTSKARIKLHKIKVLKRFREFGIDEGILAEINRSENKYMLVNYSQHKFLIENGNLEQEFILDAINYSKKEDNKVFDFTAEATYPSPINNMNVHFYDKKNKEPLTPLTDSKDESLSKKFTVRFSNAIKYKDIIQVKFGYTLKDTIKNKGKDYLLSTLSFTKKVIKHKIIIVFKNNPPEYIYLVNIVSGEELDLSNKYTTDNITNWTIYEYEANSTEVKDLNKLRVLIFFTR